MKKELNIHNLKFKKSRNLLRGIIGENDSDRTKYIMDRIAKFCGPNEYRQSIRVLKDNRLFESNGLTRNFNTFCPKLINKEILFSTRSIINSINDDSEKILDILETYKTILDHINSLDFNSAIDEINVSIEKKGVSVFLIRILIFIRNCSSDDGSDEKKSLKRNVQEILERIKIRNVTYLYDVIREASNERTNYFTIAKKILNPEVNSPANYIAMSFFENPLNNGDAHERTLTAYYLFSLIDAFLYLSSISRIQEADEVIAYNLNIHLIEKYKKISEIKFNMKCFNRQFDSDEYNDLGTVFFRNSFLLSEIDECYKYNSIHRAIYKSEQHKKVSKMPKERQWSRSYFESVNSLSDLRQKPLEKPVISIDKYNANACSLLENSTALIQLLERFDGDIAENEDSFITLMTFTRDIGYICPETYLQRIIEHANSEILKLIVLCLLSIKKKSSIVDHQLRSVIQSIAANRFGGDITKLIESLYQTSPAVSEFFIEICDETFLSKLFHITDKPNSAIEDRAKILEWYGKATSDTSLIERAKNLRIDIQISREKGTIDDSRIYVDPVKYVQWFSDSKSSDLCLLLDLLGHEKEISLSHIEWDTVNSSVSTQAQICSLLLESYSEFCENKLFGIASYLGRRIRHGTLTGTGLKGVQELGSSEEYSSLFIDQEFSRHFESWLTHYKDIFQDLTSTKLHIHTKRKSEGMIHASLNSAFKKAIADRMYVDVVNSFVKNRGGIELPYVVAEYCWRIIEDDLESIRKYLMERKSRDAIFKYQTAGNNNGSKKMVQAFSNEVNAISADRFRVISSWFNKPSIASPSADIVLLFKAVISEVGGLIESFNPKIYCDEDKYLISGGAYFSIYDALYILIFNAATYGEKDGDLVLKIERVDNFNFIRISVVSQLKGDASQAEELITQALDADFSDANVIEGRSGIKKLRQLENEQYIRDIAYSFQNNCVTASFHFRVDL